MNAREQLEAKIVELEQQQANGDDSRLTKLRLNSLYVLRAGAYKQS